MAWGAIAAALTEAAGRFGVDLRIGSEVVGIDPSGDGVEVSLADGTRLQAASVVACCAPSTLQRLPGRAEDLPEGSQLKVNLVLRRLPRLRSGVKPETVFAGTLHLHQGYARLSEARAEARAGRLPDPLRVEVYCHTLTDPSILSPPLRAAGVHALTMFGLLTPARLFDGVPGTRGAALAAALRSLQDVLAEPLEDCQLRDVDGRPCVEVMPPLDIDRELNMPGGNIFHGDLDWPWLAANEVAPTAAER